MDALFSKTSMSNVGRTLILNLLYVFCMLATVLGIGVIIVGMSDNRVLLYMFYPMVGFGQLFFVCATLSVSTVWNSMAKKAAPIILAPVDNGSNPQIPSTAERNGTADANESCFFRATPCCCRNLIKIPKVTTGVGALVPISLSALTVAMMISYFSPLYITAALSVCCLVIALSFAAAGSRTARLLAQSSEPVSPKPRTLWKLSCCKRNSDGNQNKSELQLSSRRNRQSSIEGSSRELEDSRISGEPQQSSASCTAAVLSSAGAEAESNLLMPSRIPNTSLQLQPQRVVADNGSQQLPQASTGVLQVAAQIRGTAQFIVG